MFFLSERVGSGGMATAREAVTTVASQRVKGRNLLPHLLHQLFLRDRTILEPLLKLRFALGDLLLSCKSVVD